MASSDGSRPRWMIILIWSIGLAILAGLMWKDFRPLIDEYRYNNIAAQIRIRGQNSSVKPPDVVFCIPRSQAQVRKVGQHFQKLAAGENSRCDDCEKLTEHSWDVWSEASFKNCTCVEDYWAVVSKALRVRLFQKGWSDEYGVLRTNNSGWNHLIVHAVWDFFACVRAMDDEMGMGPPNKTSTKPCLMTKEDRVLVSQKRRIDKLFDRLLHLICTSVEFSDPNLKYPTNYTSWSEKCLDTLHRVPSAIDEDDICFPLPMTETGLAIVVRPFKNSSILATINDTGDAYLVFTDKAKTTWGHANQQNSGLVYQSKDAMESVSIGYLVVNRVIEMRDGIECYAESTSTECKGNCMISKIMGMCQCIPFTYRYGILKPPAFQYCTEDMYEQCAMDKAEEEDLCFNDCKDPCEHTFYEWRESRRYAEEAGVNITITPVISPHIEFIITFKNSREQFLSQIGSVFNFYLGFNGLYLIAGAIYVMNLIMKKYVARKPRLHRSNARREAAVSPIALVGNFSTVSPVDVKIERLRLELKTEMEKRHEEMRQAIGHLERVIVLKMK